MGEDAYWTPETDQASRLVYSHHDTVNRPGPGTWFSYTSNIYRKLHIFDRTQAVIYAVREGVIDVGDLEYRPPREPSP